MGVDPATKQASLFLISSFTGKLRHWAQHNTEALYSLNFVTQLVDLLRYGFVIKDYQAKNLNLLVKLEQGYSDVPDYTRKFNDYHSFWKSEISEIKFWNLFVHYMSLFWTFDSRLTVSLFLGKFKSLSELQLHAARSNLCRLPTTSRVDSQRQLQPTVLKAFGSSKGNWKRRNKHSKGGRSQHFDKFIRPSICASGSEGHGHGNSSIGHKRKLPPRAQKKKDSWLKAKQKLSQAEF